MLDAAKVDVLTRFREVFVKAENFESGVTENCVSTPESAYARAQEIKAGAEVMEKLAEATLSKGREAASNACGTTNMTLPLPPSLPVTSLTLSLHKVLQRSLIKELKLLMLSMPLRGTSASDKAALRLKASNSARREAHTPQARDTEQGFADRHKRLRLTTLGDDTKGRLCCRCSRTIVS